MQTMLEFINRIRVYHWKTTSYARHKTTDKFMQLYNNNFDRLVETMMGAADKRIYNNFDMIIEEIDDDNAVDVIKEHRKFLQNVFPKKVDKKASDILNIRDEILADVNRVLYLFTLQ